jgi:CDP-diacylglycerol--glycerol-3-phosphate 3-phosphatidyltransferase
LPLPFFEFFDIISSDYSLNSGGEMKKHIANIVTSIRILGSACMLCSSAFSPLFYCTYLLCGFTDMIDGTVARKTNSVTSFGSQLDSIADLIFLTAASIKILPAIYIPNWLWCSVLIVFILKITAVIWRYILVRQFVLKHTLMNKLTGVLLFLLPFSLPFVEIKYSAGIVCTVAFISVIQELKNLLSNANHS